MGDDPSIRWQLANPYGILRDPASDAWNSGHATDVLELPSGGLLVSTRTGGVWTIATTGATTPLSDTWVNPDVNCLAYGTDNPDQHFFAGCKGGIIRETNLSASIPLLDWQPIDNPLPSAAGDVHRIVIIPAQRRIIAACNGGIYWSVIPSTSLNPGCLMPFLPKGTRSPFVWKQAKVVGREAQGFGDLAIAATTNDQRILALQDPRVITIVAGAVPTGGIFVGQWDSGGNLVMKGATLIDEDGLDATYLLTAMGTTSVSSCETQPTGVFAACAWPDGRLNSILYSGDGGRNWKFAKAMIKDPPEPNPLLIIQSAVGKFGGYTNCISVAPTNPRMVVLGWEYGPFISLDGGDTWAQFGARPHLHDDIHRLRFSASESAGNSLYVCSDGGLARVDIDGFLANNPSYQSNYNRLLPTLQCYSSHYDSNRVTDGESYGSLAPSLFQPGLISAGLQDNGNCYCLTLLSAVPWQYLNAGDGGWNAFLADDTLLTDDSVNTDPDSITPVSASHAFPDLSGPEFGKIVVVPITSPNDADPPFLAPLKNSEGRTISVVGDPVRNPLFRNKNQSLLYAIAALQDGVYGCYGDSANVASYHWDLITILPDGVQVSAVASYDGTIIYAGTTNGRIFVIDTDSARVLFESPVILPSPTPKATVKGGQVNRIVDFPKIGVFATMNGATANYPDTVTSYYVLRLEDRQWVVTLGSGLPQQDLYGFEVVQEPQSRVPNGLFVTTDDRVYISRDEGSTWKQASSYLPRNPHCSDLRWVSTNNGAWLYLSTYGRSVYCVKLR